jgi:hypothetical protein
MYHGDAGYNFEFWLDENFGYLVEYKLLPSCFQAASKAPPSTTQLPHTTHLDRKTTTNPNTTISTTAKTRDSLCTAKTLQKHRKTKTTPVAFRRVDIVDIYSYSYIYS